MVSRVRKYMHKPVRVLHFADVINRYDFIDMVIRFADPSQFHMMACTFTGESNIEPPEYSAEGIQHFVLRIQGRKNFPLAVWRLAQLLRHEHVDILHAHHFDGAFLGVCAALVAHTPAVVIGRHYHDEIYLLTGGINRWAHLAIERFVNRFADVVVVPSVPIRNLMVGRQGVPLEKVAIIPYGFDFQAPRYQQASLEATRGLRQKLGVNGHFVIVNVGRHHSLKGQEFLLRAFACYARDYPEDRLLLVGDGPDHKRLRHVTQDLNLTSSVLFAGWQSNVHLFMEAADVVAHPTLHEAFPQVVVEAMIHARPLIVTPVAGPGDFVTDKETGIFVPARDIEALYQALLWVRRNPQHAQKMGEAARAHVRSLLDIRTVIRQFEGLYHHLAGGSVQSFCAERDHELAGN